jgi:hypothetical protein
MSPQSERHSGRPDPTRQDRERSGLVEIDAIVAIMLGITADELCAIYRTQFGVLRKYERRDRYDRNGRKVDLDVLRVYQRWEDSGRASKHPDLGRFELPFRAMNREVEMRSALKMLQPRLDGQVPKEN